MDVQTEKIELVRGLLDTDDESLLQEVKDVLENHEKDFWNELPQYVKDGVERSLKQAEQGLVTPHSEVMKKFFS